MVGNRAYNGTSERSRGQTGGRRNWRSKERVGEKRGDRVDKRPHEWACECGNSMQAKSRMRERVDKCSGRRMCKQKC